MLQDARASASDPAVICSFDYEAIDKPTRAIIHQAARFLYVKRGRGKLVIDGEEYVLQPNTLVAITPWKITDTVEVTETLQFIKVIYDYSYLNSVFKSVLGSGDASAEPLRFLPVEPVAYLDSVQAEYVDGIMEPQDSIKGQAYMAMTITAGNVMSSLLGGWLIDAAGVGAMLICASLAAFIGWLIVCLGSKEAKTA